VKRFLRLLAAFRHQAVVVTVSLSTFRVHRRLTALLRARILQPANGVQAVLREADFGVGTGKENARARAPAEEGAPAAAPPSTFLGSLRGTDGELHPATSEPTRTG
jgi:hypothetical protein